MNPRILIAIGVGVVLLIVSVILILDSQGYFIPDEEPEEEEEEVVVNVGNSYYVPMPRPFVFNLQSGDRIRTIQISVQVMVRGAKNERIALNNVPLMENALINEFTGSEYNELLTQSGRQDLNVRCLRAIQTVFRKVAGTKVIEQVLFTGFVIQ